MRSQIKPRIIRVGGCVLLCVMLLGVAGRARGQAEQSPPPHMIILGPARTALGDQILAEAAYMAAYGDMVKSVAQARKINAEAVAKEIENSIEYVDAYFKRRELNREWRAKEDPNYLERETRRQQVLERRVKDQYQDVLRGDVTKSLNWLLRELARPVVSYQYLAGTATLVHSPLDQTLARKDLEQIMLTDGGNKANQLVVGAADGKSQIEQIQWPLGMRGPECAAARAKFEGTLAGALAEIKERGEVSHENETKLTQDVNALFVALDDAYPRERLKERPAEILTYNSAKRFLGSTVAAVRRVVTAHDSYLLGGGLRFQGDSVVGLIQHMYQTGSEFAPPNAGGEGVYKSLFQSLRTLYLNIGPDQSPAEVQKRATGGVSPAGNNQDKPAGN